MFRACSLILFFFKVLVLSIRSFVKSDFLISSTCILFFKIKIFLFLEFMIIDFLLSSRIEMFNLSPTKEMKDILVNKKEIKIYI